MLFKHRIMYALNVEIEVEFNAFMSDIRNEEIVKYAFDDLLNTNLFDIFMNEKSLKLN